MRRGFHDRQGGFGSLHLADGDVAVQLDDRRRGELGENFVQGDDALPVGIFGARGARVASGDGRLELITSWGFG